MWKDYSIGFIKKNRASSVSVLVAAFISALFLSLLCGLFYNFWNYEIESVVLEEGNWQGRISGALEEDELSEIENFANVKTVAINEDLSDEQTLVVDICFDDMRAVYQDMPLIAQQLGVPETSVSYHESLLSSYFINDPQNSNPPLLMAFYLFVLLLVSVSLILIIHNSFAVSMNARVHQFGMEFLAVAPIVPILLFIAALFGFVALAYYLGGKKILKCDLVEALRTDYMG